MIERATLFAARHPRGVDVAVALFWTLLSFGNDSVLDNADRRYYLVPLFIVAGLALFWRRTSPLAVWFVQGAIVVAMIFINNEDDVPISILCGAYSLGAHEQDRKRGVAAFVAFVAVGVSSVLAVDIGAVGDAAAIVLILTVGWVAGDNMRTRRAFQRSLVERAERAEALRDSLAQQAVAEERARIARDLHDVVAHSMSLMVVQAGAARRVARTDPDASVDALEAIESVGRNSLEEMRRILDVLRSDADAAQTAPQPDLAALENLVDEFAAAGLPVEVQHTGDRQPLPASVELTAFRIVQESLTNVLKHAGQARASVSIDHQPQSLAITVRDDGQASVSAARQPGSQRGHVGIRERVAAFGGSFSAGPRLSGGYQVHAEIPLPEDDE